MRQADNPVQATAPETEKPARIPTRKERPSLAVLPFDELGAPDTDMFADGVVEEITSALSRVHEFHVVARQSAYALADRGVDALKAAARLGTDYLVEGSLRRAGDRVRISVQLIDGKSANTLWAHRFDDRLDDLFDLQDRIAAQVAGQISPNLRTAEIARASDRPPTDRSTYELVLTALPAFWAHTRDGNARALALLDRALEIDPNFGPALAYKAWVLAQQPSYMWSDDPLGDKAQALDLAKQAAAMTTDHAPSHVAIGAAVSLVSDDLLLANAHIDRALTIDPNNAWGWLRRGWNRAYASERDEARDCFARVAALSPLDPFLFNVAFGFGAIFMSEGRLDDALAQFRRGMSLSPNIEWAHRLLAVCHMRLGQIDKAMAEFRLLEAAYPGMTIQKLADSIPPSVVENQPEYYDALRKAGMPER